jgi:DNA primase
MGTAHTIDELKALIDPLTVYQEYVRLTRRGRRSLGLCPFHKEKTPSFSVDTENGLFYCFGCHKGGDLIQFLQEIEGCSFPEALEILARKTGVTLARRTPAKGEAPDRKERLRKLLTGASAYYRQALVSASAGSRVRAYVKARGIRPETEEALGLGYAPAGGGLLPHLRREGFSVEEAQEAGLVIEKNRGEWFERFRNRLLFPIVDLMGRTVGFGGRALGDDEPKYLNSPESPIFQKRDVLFGLNLSKAAVREKEQLLLVEGYMDYLAVTQAGVSNAAATLGTALAEGQVRILKRYAREVVLNFDQDRAGMAAVQRAIQILLGEGVRIRVLSVPDGKDPDEFIRKNGAEAYRGLVENARPFFDHVVDGAQSEAGTLDVPGKMAFLEEIVPYLSAVSDPIERQEYAKEVAGRLGMDPAPVLQRLSRGAVGDKVSHDGKRPSPFSVPVTEQILVMGILAYPEAAAGHLASLPPEAVQELSVAELVGCLARGGKPQGPEQTSLLAYIQNSCHELASEKDLENAVADVATSFLRKRERQIQQQIKEASQANDFGLIQILNREKMALLQQIQSLERQ